MPRPHAFPTLSRHIAELTPDWADPSHLDQADSAVALLRDEQAPIDAVVLASETIKRILVAGLRSSRLAKRAVLHTIDAAMASTASDHCDTTLGSSVFNDAHLECC